VQTGWPSLRRTTVQVACVLVAAIAVLTVAELTSERFNKFTGDHSLIATFITEGILLVSVYLVIDEIIERRETRRWSDVTSLGMRTLSVLAHRPAEIIRRSVDELTVETAHGQPDSPLHPGEASPSRPVDYQELVVRHADELRDWLRADEARARSFSEETRVSAARLEEAIIRWGPTLVEAPDSAELLNLLPDIVDSARSAAQAIVPTSGGLDSVRGKQETGIPEGAWTEGDRRRFKDSLLEILRNESKFDQRLPR
jgi:hypothetical protein